jgi:hypothetical protein
METARALIKDLRRENIHHRKFVPELSLWRTITKEVIRKALEHSSVTPYQQKEVATKIFRSGRKIFAILILTEQVTEVLKFIEADQLHDTRLPFELGTLRDEIAISNLTDFEETQWEFVAPTFVRGTLHRVFRDKAIIPFVSRSDEGRGAFGKVFKVQLQLDHQELNGSFPSEVSRTSCFFRVPN